MWLFKLRLKIKLVNITSLESLDGVFIAVGFVIITILIIDEHGGGPIKQFIEEKGKCFSELNELQWLLDMVLFTNVVPHF